LKEKEVEIRQQDASGEIQQLTQALQEGEAKIHRLEETVSQGDHAVKSLEQTLAGVKRDLETAEREKAKVTTLFDELSQATQNDQHKIQE